ncbi:MAG: glycosyltransferase, partial [Pyrinomonadaceae bacterium]
LEVFRENRGAVHALNSAIQRSSGEFICYLSSDDYFLPGKLHHQVAFLRDRPGISAVFGLSAFIDERGTSLQTHEQYNGDIFETPFKKNLKTSDDWLRHFFFSANCLCHPTVMIRRAAYDTVGLYDPRFANLPDLDMWIRLCMGANIAVLPKQLVAMRIRDDSRNMSAPKRGNLLRTYFEMFELLKHYKRMPLASLRRVFAVEIANDRLMAIDEPELLLAEIALTSSGPMHGLFGLDTMFNSISASDRSSHKRLIELSGGRDIFDMNADALRRNERPKKFNPAKIHKSLQRRIGRIINAMRTSFN